MKLWGLSDVHVRFPENRAVLEALTPRPEDWLIVCGDVGETMEHLEFTLDTLGRKFARLLWVPGNHELWTMPSEAETGPRGVARYEAMVALCRQRGVLTPEDPYVTWTGEAGPLVLAPMFLLYDYTFAPDGHTGAERALAWASEDGILCTDESLLHPDPYPTREAWCQARCDATEARLSALPRDSATVLINHFPLRRDVVFIPRVPRFIPWCGTRRTEDWHTRFNAQVVVSGHLHVRSTQWRDGVRFEEVSLGYPRQWNRERAPDDYVRQILPATMPVSDSPRYYR
jgi:predicted phosphodiesterase